MTQNRSPTPRDTSLLLPGADDGLCLPSFRAFFNGFLFWSRRITACY